MDLTKFFLEELHSDVAFIVGPETGQTWRFPAHRFILSVASQVFERMFTGNFTEKNSSWVRVTDTTPLAFKFMLQYIYKLDFQLDNVQLTYQVLQVAQKYLLSSLVDKCIGLLIPNVEISTFIPIYYLTHEIEEDRRAELLLICLEFLDANVYSIVQRNEFILLDQFIIEEILDRDSLKVKEIDLFNSVMNWAKHQCCKKKLEINQKSMRLVLSNALYKIRFLNMNWEELDNIFTNFDLFTSEEKKCFTKFHLKQPFTLQPLWDVDLLNRPRNMCNYLQYRFWDTIDNAQAKKEDWLYITLSCDIILKKVIFSVHLDESKLVLLQGSIEDLHGLVIQNWKFKKMFIEKDDSENVQRVLVEIPATLNAFKCYKIHVICFYGSLCSGGSHNTMYGRCTDPKQVILHCKSGPNILVEESWKTYDYWKRVFTDFEWSSYVEPLNLNSAFEKINFFVMKRNNESFVMQLN